MSSYLERLKTGPRHTRLHARRPQIPSYPVRLHRRFQHTCGFGMFWLTHSGGCHFLKLLTNLRQPENPTCRDTLLPTASKFKLSPHPCTPRNRKRAANYVPYSILSVIYCKHRHSGRRPAHTRPCTRRAHGRCRRRVGEGVQGRRLEGPRVGGVMVILKC